MATASQAVATRPSAWSRVYGFGSIFAKTVRDSRRATIIAAVLLVVSFVGVGRAIVTQFATPESRAEIDAIVAAVPPILQGLAGKAVNVGTLGGYFQYKYGTFFPIILSLWSILALSATLASEAARGSLEVVASTGRSRRRIALEKVSGHLLAMTVACFVAFLSIAYVGTAYATLPGDEISVTQALGYAVWLGLMALAAGGLAFAASAFVGRGAAAGISGFVMMAGYILYGYQQPVPQLAPWANLTWWGWTQNHLPLAGQFDWPSIGVLAVVVVVLFAIGIEAFVRRDIGATSTVLSLSTPRPLLGLSGPLARAIAYNLPAAVAWGIGVALFGLVFGSASGPFMEQLKDTPDFV
jgi:ABC-2 type transport system permease protein